MSQSPTRTPALLAANRANAQKSTGPRTPEGKRRAEKLQRFLAQAEAGSAAREPQGAASSTPTPAPREAEELLGLYRALGAALLPDPENESQMRYVRRCTVSVWTAKGHVARLAASRSWRQLQFGTSAGVFPAPLRLRIRRTGWRVTVSLWVRRGRCHGHCRVRPACGWQEGRARLHAGVTVTSSMRHPVEEYSSLEEPSPGIAPRVAFRTKPEYCRKQGKSKNVITIGRVRRGDPLGWGLGGIAEKARRLVRGLGTALLRSGGRRPSQPLY